MRRHFVRIRLEQFQQTVADVTSIKALRRQLVFRGHFTSLKDLRVSRQQVGESKVRNLVTQPQKGNLVRSQKSRI